MTDYEIVVNIEKGALKSLIEGDFKLCMAKGVRVFDNDREPEYNVVALARDVMSFNNIKFTTNYSMFATKQCFHEGKVVVKDGSDCLPIGIKEKFHLKNWADVSVENYDEAPPKGFTFENETWARVVIALRDGISHGGSTTPEKDSPFFISPECMPGRSTLVPTDKIALWFQKGLKTGTMISLDNCLAHYIDLTIKTQKTTVTYTNGYEWQDSEGVPSQPIDYTKITAAHNTVAVQVDTAEQKADPASE